jgi:hypothetical protein
VATARNYPLIGRPSVPLKERFWSKVRKTKGCWIWTAGGRPYGRIGAGGTGAPLLLAHRVSYEWKYGPIPDNLEIDHICRNTLCVRPSHLEAVTSQMNLGRRECSIRLLTMRCGRGHDLTVEGVLIAYGQQTVARWRCRACARENARARRPVVAPHVHHLHRGANNQWSNKTLKERFLEKVRKTRGCWLWTGALDRAGYGHFGSGGRGSSHKNLTAHRVAYELLVRPIPRGLQIDHLCNHPWCVRPDHLEPVTPGENTRRSVMRRKAA